MIVKHGEVYLGSLAGSRWNLCHSCGDLLFGRDEEPGPCEDPAEGVSIIGGDLPPKQAGLDHGCSPPRERVIDPGANPCQVFDEEVGELRFETGPVGDFMDRRCLPLSRGPELTGITGDSDTRNIDSLSIVKRTRPEYQVLEFAL